MIYMELPIQQRYFMLVLVEDILGEWSLGAFSGRLDNKKKSQRWLHFIDEKSARTRMFELENNKRQQGYRYAQYPLESMFDLVPQLLQDILAEKTNAINENVNRKKYEHVNLETSLLDQLELLI